MKYTSTRDASIVATFEEAICSGYASDDGLFVPESLPNVTPEKLEAWSKLTFPQLAEEVLRLFIATEEISDSDLESICQSALQGFDHPDHVPIRQVGRIYVAELFHGPTFCFKDLGMRGLVAMLSFFATRRKCKTTLLAATTGDTGPAAVQAVSDINNPLLTILVHYPKGQISDFQRKQLTTVQSPFAKIATFEGGGDDMDKPIKNLLTQQHHQKQKSNVGGTGRSSRLSGVNSYNIGRPLMQMVHYIWAYLRVIETLKKKPGSPDLTVDVVLPTGAMGNIVGGYMAKQMGVPFGYLCSGTNINDITDRVMKTGKFYKSDKMERTLSEALNIQLVRAVRGTINRLGAPLIHKEVKAWMATVDLTSKNDLTPDWLALLQKEFKSERVTDEEMCDITREVLADYQYMTDPHTAVAFGAAKKLGYMESDKKTVILLSTASPCKFEEAVTTAVGTKAWQNYYDTEFPARGKAVLEREEIDPVLYKALDGVPLEKTQLEWESQARDLIANLSSVADDIV